MAKLLNIAMRLFGFSPTKGRDSLPRRARASHYDLADTSELNAAHWAGADGFDSDKANNPQVRMVARNRSRKETDNNPSLKGITRTIANYEIGTGPTLHIEHDDDDFSREVETKWSEWCEATNFHGKLWSMVYSRVSDGESFAKLGFNPYLDNPVQLDVRPFECDQCYTLWLPYLTPNRIDGIWFDDWGNPTYYDVLWYHPGGVFPMPAWRFDTIPAQFILHLFHPERPNQHRGMPELVSSVDLFADRRRHRKATVLAAETCAKIAIALSTKLPAGMEQGDRPEDYSPTSIPMNSIFMCPDGTDPTQIKSEHPSQTYEAFASETLNEAGRPASVPLNIAKCDSSHYNMASGRLDITTFYESLKVNQRNNTHRTVNPIFVAWYAEARLVYGWKAKDGGKVPGRQFLWQGQPYSDPEAEQNADEKAISTGLKGIQDIYARRGKDWNRQAPLNAKALGFKSVDEYMVWVRANLTAAKGGMQGDGQEKQLPQNANDNGQPKNANGHAAGTNGHNRITRYLRASADSQSIIEVPDIRQHDFFSCGAASSMCVGKYFHVGPDTLPEWKKALGTDIEESTKPQAIVDYFESLGLQVTARDGMTIDDLAACIADGMPVIVPVQDYGPAVPKEAKFAYGHYLTVIGVLDAGQGYVMCQDSSADNVVGNSGSDEAPGRVVIAKKDFDELWHDRDVDGNKYVHFGIAVGSPVGKTNGHKQNQLLEVS
jgi:capsid protein